MKRVAYGLVLLLISAQVQDTWAVALVLPSTPLADENDEYLPVQRQPRGEQPSSSPKPLFNALKPPAVDVSFVPRGVPAEWILTTPFAPPLLYIFMSLQI
jgi:hypothetical protein